MHIVKQRLGLIVSMGPGRASCQDKNAQKLIPSLLYLFMGGVALHGLEQSLERRAPAVGLWAAGHAKPAQGPIHEESEAHKHNTRNKKHLLKQTQQTRAIFTTNMPHEVF